MQSARPFILASRLRTANDQLEREWLRYRLANQRDERATRALQTDAGIREAARKLGYVMPNEQRLKIIPGRETP